MADTRTIQTLVKRRREAMQAYKAYKNYLQTAYGRGCTLEELSLAVNASVPSLSQQLRRMGTEMRARGRPKGPGNRAEETILNAKTAYRLFHKEKLSYREIGERLGGKSRERVRQLIEIYEEEIA